LEHLSTIGLDTDCSPKAHVVKDQSPGWHYWEMVELLGRGRLLGGLGHWSVPLKKLTEP
jgi:hypothetical protein